MKKRITIFSADDEEPDCMRCDGLTEYSDETCSKRCGSEHYWNLYKRTKISNDGNTDGNGIDLRFDEQEIYGF